MADLDERLNQLISDQESMKKVLAMAKAILAQRDSVRSEPAEAAPAPPEPEILPAPQPAPSEAQGDTPSSAADMASMLAAMMAKSGSAPSSSPGESQTEAMPLVNSSSSPLAAMLPQLMQIMSGNGNLVKSERVNLLQAMRPYLKEGRAGSIDRALKMANATKAATSAMHLLGR